MNLKASNDAARKRAQAYLDARDAAAEPYLKKYGGRLPRPVVRKIEAQALKALRSTSSGACSS